MLEILNEKVLDVYSQEEIDAKIDELLSMINDLNKVNTSQD